MMLYRKSQQSDSQREELAWNANSIEALTSNKGGIRVISEYYKQHLSNQIAMPRQSPTKPQHHAIEA